MALGMKVKLMDEEETRRIFKYDKVFQSIIQKAGIDPKVLEIIYGGTTSAAFTELGTAMTAEFNGSTFEKSTVLCATRVLTPGGSYFHFYVIDSSATITQYYCWFSKYQVTTVKTLSKAATTTGTYFTIFDSEAAPTGYYVWMDKNGDGATDKPTVATLTEIVCNISAATDADSVATIVAAAVNAKAGFGASATTDTVTITHATKGDPSADAADVDTTYVITKVESGGADPGVSGTGAECDIKAATTAANVATVVQGVINALSDVTAGVSTATVTITNDEIGLVTEVTDGNTGFTITQLEQSSNNYGGAPIYLVSSSADDTDNSAKDLRKDMVIGFTPTELKQEEIAMNGTTQVKSSELQWTRIIHHGGSDWGSAGQDAKGQIDLENIDGVDYLALTAAGNESEGGVIWIPNNFHAMIAEMDLSLHDISMAAAGDGAVVKFVEYGIDDTKNNRIYNLAPDHPNIPISAVREKPHTNIKWPTKGILHGSDVAKLTLQEAKINNVTDFVFRTYVLIWYEKN